MLYFLLIISFSNYSGSTVRPIISRNGFSIVLNADSRDLYLHWKSVAMCINGCNFTYQISYMDDNRNIIIAKPGKLTETSIKIERLNYTSYPIQITSVNINGDSYDTANILIPLEDWSKYIHVSRTKICIATTHPQRYSLLKIESKHLQLLFSLYLSLYLFIT